MWHIYRNMLKSGLGILLQIQGHICSVHTCCGEWDIILHHVKADGAVLPSWLHNYKSRDSFTRKIKLLLIPHIGSQDGVEGTNQKTNTSLGQTI
jgi:hypothetical protein